MKTKLYMITIGLLMLLLSCGQPKQKTSNSVVSANSSQTALEQEEKERLGKLEQIEEQDRADSLRLDKVLKDALKIANLNIRKAKFIEKYEITSDSVPLSVEINLDYHFTKATPHLIIRINEPNAIHIDIYIKNDNSFKQVVSHEQWAMTYVNDTIRDINGDGLKDFVVNWYGATGCCLKNFSNIYLLRPDKKAFSNNFEFINPTFSPQEKVIRGVCYGHPGQTEIYKYRWSGEEIDTLEYISYQTKDDDSSIKTGKIELQKWANKKLIILDKVPEEYTVIEGYDWFTGEGYE